MAISTFTLGYFWLKRATALVTALSSAAFPKAISRRFAETLASTAKTELNASRRPAAMRRGAKVGFTVVSKGRTWLKKRLENAAMLAPTCTDVKHPERTKFHHGDTETKCLNSTARSRRPQR